ncbi:hypothetical protein H0H87_000613 [Tephrocybe sp. NHM501043]|nr:hypothetical protein H0H87_000613 [Tephrocybe sp. NHM501043]
MNLPTAVIWKKLTLIHANKGTMFETDLLNQLQMSRYVKSGDIDVCTHFANLVVIKEQLTEIGSPISDPSFTSYICTSMSLVTSFKSLFTALTTASHTSKKPTTSEELIWYLTEEANSKTIEDNINKQDEAMISAHTKSKGESNNLKRKAKAKDSCHCSNCNKDGHTDDQCFAEGGGMAGKAPKWWVKKNGGKSKGKGKGKSANAAEVSDDENFALLTCLTINSLDDNFINIALAVTSSHSHKAHAVSPSAGVIIDCGASSHFFLS